MASTTTYFVALPFSLSNGEIVPGEAVSEPSRSAAITRAQALSTYGRYCGAIAFSRTGDVDSGDFDDAVVLARFGAVPDELAGDGDSDALPASAAA